MCRYAAVPAATREGGAVQYAIAGPDIADLMRAALTFLTRILAGRAELLGALRDDPADSDRHASPLAA